MKVVWVLFSRSRKDPRETLVARRLLSMQCWLTGSLPFKDTEPFEPLLASVFFAEPAPTIMVHRAGTSRAVSLHLTLHGLPLCN